MPDPAPSLFRATDLAERQVDPAELAALHAACFTAPPPWSARDISETLASRFNFLLTLRHEGALAGFLIGSSVAGEAELLTLAVDPALRRLGLGRRLVAAFLTEAAGSGADTTFLEVSAENPAAIALYESSGFIRSGRRKAYYLRPDGGRIDALIMLRHLRP